MFTTSRIHDMMLINGGNLMRKSKVDKHLDKVTGLPLEPPSVDGLSAKKADEVWNAWFWGAYNKDCLKCVNTCKQSWQVSIVVCKSFEKAAA